MSKSYIKKQFEKLGLSETFRPKIQIYGGIGGKTHCLSISNEQLEKIKEILLTDNK